MFIMSIKQKQMENKYNGMGTTPLANVMTTMTVYERSQNKEFEKTLSANVMMTVANYGMTMTKIEKSENTLGKCYNDHNDS